MSSEVYVGPHAAVDYRVDTDLLGRALLERWPGTIIINARSPERLSLEWEIPIGDYVLSCSLDIGQQILEMDGARIDEYALVAVWFRAFIPDQYEIFLTETDGECDFLITRTTTVEQIVAACSECTM